MTIETGRLTTRMRMPSARLRIPREDTHAYVLVLVFGACFMFLFIPPLFGYRHVIYALPFGSLALALVLAEHGRLKIHVPFAIASLAFGVATFMSIFFNEITGFTTIRNVLIVLGSLIIFLPQFRVPPLAIKMLVGIMFVAMLASALQNGISGTTNLLGSQGILEHSAAYPLGVLTLYYWRMKNYRWAALCGVLCFIAFKRIVLLGLIAAIAVDITTRAIGKNQKGVERATAISAFLILVVCATLALNFDAVIYFTIRTFDLDMSPNELALGRYFYGLMITQHMTIQEDIQWIFGNGPGFVDNLLMAIDGGERRLHNDYKKILLEYGVFGSVVFFAALFKLFNTNRDGNLILISISMVFISDNAFQYLFHLFVCFMVLRAFIDHGPYSTKNPSPTAQSP